MQAVLVEPEVIDYRRLARRVRCQLGNNVAGKQRALAVLARHADQNRRDTLPVNSNPDTDVREFAAAVSAALEGPILRFSRRQQLIKQAGRLGIRRFDANLLIAAVQNRLGSEKAKPALAKESNRWRSAVPIAVAIALQLAIFAGAWAAIHS